MKLRKVTLRDAKQLLEWKNEAETRRFSIVTHNKIKWKDHLRWLRQRLEREEFYIITDGLKNYGDLRFEEGEVSIRIARAERKKKIGVWAIKKAQTMYSQLTAKIVVGNIASLNLFMGRGFRIIRYVKKYYELEWKK